MTSQVGLGVPVPRLLPITGTFAVPFITYLLVLSGRVVKERIKSHVYMGDHNKTLERDANSKRQEDDPLNIAIRAHGNFLETVPLAFILLITAELNGGNRRYLTSVMSSLFVFRLLHVEFGIYGPDNASGGRPLAYHGSNILIAGLAAYTGYLCKGYWGI